MVAYGPAMILDRSTIVFPAIKLINVTTNEIENSIEKCVINKIVKNQDDHLHIIQRPIHEEMKVYNPASFGFILPQCFASELLLQLVMRSRIYLTILSLLSIILLFYEVVRDSFDFFVDSLIKRYVFINNQTKHQKKQKLHYSCQSFYIRFAFLSVPFEQRDSHRADQSTKSPTICSALKSLIPNESFPSLSSIRLSYFPYHRMTLRIMISSLYTLTNLV